MVQQKAVQPFATIVVGSVCIAIVSYAAWISHQRPSSEAGSAKVEANLPPLTLQQISSLDQKTFERSLPQLRQAIEGPIPSAVTNQETLAAIAGKLRQTNESAPDYWPTVVRFIQFASSVIAQNVPPPGQQPRVLSEILSVGLMKGIREKGKTILLDDGYLGNGEFADCRIIFTPNPVRLTNALFRNCVFEIPTTDPPSSYIRKVCRILLSSDLRSVSIPTL
ncbi:MAG: hypothetical protein ACLQVM_28015 [Terriglobia bacterium]